MVCSINRNDMLALMMALCAALLLTAAGAASATEVGNGVVSAEPKRRTLLQTASPSPSGSVYTRACWQKAYSRGAGTVPDTCAAGLEKAGLLCYPPCQSGYTAFVASCFSICPSGYRDDGALCTRDAHIYGKGCCCTLWGCCGNCPAGYNDDGCTCHRYMHTIAKSSYTRPTYSMICPADKEMWGGLCYPKCNSGYVGNGMYCYPTSGPAGYGIKCGDNAWAKDDQACSALVQEEAALGIRIGVGAGACLTAVVISIASAGLLSAIPAAICPQAVIIAAGAAENAVRLAAFPKCA